MSFNSPRNHAANLGHPGAGYIHSVREDIGYSEGFLESRNALSTTVGTAAEKRMAAMLDPQRAAEELRLQQTTFPQRLQEVSNAYKEPIKEMKTRVLASMRKTPELLDRIQKIMNALTHMPRAFNAEMEHRYLDAQGVQYLALENDQQFLNTMKDGHPEISAELSLLHNGLEEIARQDRQYGIRQFEKYRDQPSSVEKLASQTGKGVLLFVGAISAVAFGIGVVNLIRGKGKGPGVGSLLFLVLGLSTIPAIRHAFSPKEQEMLRQIEDGTNHRLFRDMCRDYNVTGPTWANFIHKTMQEPADAQQLVSSLKGKNREEETKKFLQASRLKPEEKTELHRMIEDGRFADFVQVLSGITDKDARALTTEFIRTGAQKYERKIEDAKTEALKESR